MVRKIFLIIGILSFCVLVSSNSSAKEMKEGSYSKITADYQFGKINYEEFLLYKTRVIFNPTELENTPYSLTPEELKPVKCGTSLILEIQGNWNSLSESTKKELSFVFKRPTCTSLATSRQTGFFFSL